MPETIQHIKTRQRTGQTTNETTTEDRHKTSKNARNTAKTVDTGKIKKDRQLT